MKYLVGIAMAALLFSCSSKKQESQKALPYEYTWESVAKHSKNPEFFQDAKFGIYTHWGPVTVATDCSQKRKGGVQWHGRGMYQKKNNAFKYHKDRFGDQNEVGFKEVTKMFKPDKFDANQWAELFARAGARFAGPVAIHHDNYAMWDSEVTPWNSMDGAPHQDFTGELAKAIKSKGMKFLATFHHSYTWEYFRPSYAFDGADGKNKSLYCEPHDEMDPPSRAFLDNWLKIVDEVVVKYEPDMIWFDMGFGWLIPDEYQIKMFANYYNWADANNKDVAAFHKSEKTQRYTGILDFERGRASGQTKYPWLTDTSLGPWFHDPTHPYYETNQLIDIFIDIISKNGCMLLNVGPQADGSIPEEAQKMLLEIGDWIEVNGEGVFNTRPWKLFGEGPTKMKKSGGFSESKDFNYTDKDIRFTRSKDNKTIYAFVLGWPESNSLNITSFNKENGVTIDNIKEVSLLGSNEPVKVSKGEKGIHVDLPKTSPCKHAYCVKFTLK
ncbi:alpha-L-fucosidase [Prolixibacteraceae bacterium]|nr:alpha-L-fucosidase [Prolixibacteraceae bacterium]